MVKRKAKKDSQVLDKMKLSIARGYYSLFGFSVKPRDSISPIYEQFKKSFGMVGSNGKKSAWKNIGRKISTNVINSLPHIDKSGRPSDRRSSVAPTATLVHHESDRSEDPTALRR